MGSIRAKGERVKLGDGRRVYRGEVLEGPYQERKSPRGLETEAAYTVKWDDGSVKIAFAADLEDDGPLVKKWAGGIITIGEERWIGAVGVGREIDPEGRVVVSVSRKGKFGKMQARFDLTADEAKELAAMLLKEAH